MSQYRVTVVVPTLAADTAYLDCLASLSRQTVRDIRVVVVDNSGQNRVPKEAAEALGAEVMRSASNVGFGAAINLAYRSAHTPYLATINDDAIAEPQWLEALLAAMDSDGAAGMCASQVRLSGERGLLDSAGMLIAGDGSSKQRGHREPAGNYGEPGETLFPSGCACVYRREMLEEVGVFDEDFFLYCEDTDLGLRARWAGWKCHYAARAVVEHRYSHTAGRASPLKAYLVERNRLFVVLKNFPLLMLCRAPFYSLIRYFWHGAAMVKGEGAAGKYRAGGNSAWRLAWFILKAHLEALRALPSLLRKRREVLSRARLDAAEFERLMKSHWISTKQVAAL